MSEIPDPVGAVTAADPYACYAELRGRGPLFWHQGLKLWTATDAAAVDAVLSHPALRVRPAAEPVPRAIAGDAAGAVFGRLARMNDGPAHLAARQALLSRLAMLDPVQLRQQAHRHAAASPPRDAAALDAWIVRVPLLAMAGALGLPEPVLDEVAAEVQDFVAGLSPLSSALRLASAAEAAHRLAGRFGAVAGTAPQGLAQDAWIANLVGLLSQTCDATAGLLGNAIVACAREPGLWRAVACDAALLGDAVDEVARHDPSIQNTRRYAPDHPVELIGRRIEPGQAVLALLASANRDGAANTEPDVFRLRRSARRHHGYGRGAHQCPGQALAGAIAQGALAALHDDAIESARDFLLRPRYRPSINARIPRFNSQETA